MKTKRIYQSWRSRFRNETVRLFFQVTETLDVRKYILDIEKVEKYPITFVVKSLESIENTKYKIRSGAEKIWNYS